MSRTDTVPAAGSRWASAWQTVRWYVHSVMGDNAYAKYVAHLRRQDPDCQVPTEREFWDAKYADVEANPKSRCC